MKYNTLTNLKIYETNDYDIFKIYTSNRDLINNKKLEKVILERNNLKYNPLIVSKDYEVLDGQHRLHVAKKHNLPIYYIVKEDAEICDIQKMNIANTNWRLKDHAKYFMSLGKYNYEFLMSLHENYGIPIASILMYFSKNYERTSYKNGDLRFRYEFSEMIHYAKMFKDIMTKFYEISLGKKPDRHFINALLHIVSQPDYDHEFFLRQIDNTKVQILVAAKYNKTEDCKNILLENIYHWGPHGKKKTALF